MNRGTKVEKNRIRRVNRAEGPVLVKKLVSNNHVSFDFLISGGAFDLRERPVCQCAWFQGLQ